MITKVQVFVSTYPQNLIKIILNAACKFCEAGQWKSTGFVNLYHRQIFFSQALSHQGKHYHSLLEERGLILCLIYRAVYLNVIKDFSPRKGAKLFDVSIIAPLENQKKKNPDSEAPLCLKQKDVKEIRLVVLEELRKSLGV